METKPKHKIRNSAFSLTELLAVVATFAIIGGIAISYVIDTRSTIQTSKLNQDVSRLNSAVQVFLSNAGSLEGITSAQDVLTELKKAASNEKQVVGLRGSVIDPRLKAVSETDADLRERAIWMPELNKFVLEESKTGVSEFILNEELGRVDYAMAERQTKLVYNESAGWVWATGEHSLSTSTGPSLLALDAPTLGAASSSGSANSSRLAEPLISPESGTFGLSAFPLQVTIAKQPSDPDDATIWYSTETGTWSQYTGPFSVAPGTSVAAYTSHEDPDLEDSNPRTAIFNNAPEALSIAISIPKNPLTYAEAGGELEPGDYPEVPSIPAIVVSLTSDSAANIPDEYENSDNFQFFWTYDGSDPRTSPDRNNGGFVSKSHTNNGHGNNVSGTDISNPAYISWAEANGIDLSAYTDDEVKSQTFIDYSIANWDGSSLLPIQVVADSTNQSIVTSSQVISANISIARTNLPAPSVSYDSEETDRGDTVELEKIVDEGTMPVGARIYYTTDGTDPGDDGKGNPLTGTLYTGPFDPLLGNDSGSEALIVARVYPPEEYSAWFNVSAPASSAYSIADWEISGSSTGWFSGARGPGGMVASFGGDNFTQTAGSYFQWGDPGSYGVGANWLDFNGASFSNVKSDERFLIGKLGYFNGTINMGSLATGVDFAVQLEFNNNQTRFDYSFDLLTTENNGTAWENADYVWFNNVQSAQNVALYGSDYSLNLEFGEATEAGFTSIDQFHVLEGQSATASIYASLVSLGSWW